MATFIRPCKKSKAMVRFTPLPPRRFPQPEPGKAECAPAPMKVPAEQLRSVLGVTNVDYVRGCPCVGSR